MEQDHWTHSQSAVLDNTGTAYTANGGQPTVNTQVHIFANDCASSASHICHVTPRLVVPFHAAVSRESLQEPNWPNWWSTSWFGDVAPGCSVICFFTLLKCGCQMRYWKVFSFSNSSSHCGHIFHYCPAGDQTQAKCSSSCWCFSLNSNSAFSTRCTLTWERGTYCPLLLTRLNKRVAASQGDD